MSMNDVNLTPLLKSKFTSYARQRGRYNSSELFFILHANGHLKTTPEKWMNAPQREVKDMLNMWTGTGMHNQLEELMGKEHSEKKTTFDYKGMTLVAKADFMPPHKPDDVWEFKTSDKLMKEAKPWHKHQTKIYTTMFEKKRGSVYQPIQDQNGLYLKHLGTVERDDKWFHEEMEELYKFHLLVEELWKLRTS